eukprot:m.30973 g.30973  ORF g.30973 m.30973 type:complete len:183 (-) comp12022_c1_seq2:912-1460(-)
MQYDDMDDNDDGSDDSDDNLTSLATPLQSLPKPSTTATSSQVSSSLPPMDAYLQRQAQLQAPAPDTVACPLCDAKFATARAAQHHYDTEHDVDKDAQAAPSGSEPTAVLCPICSQSFGSAASAALHINGHFDPTPKLPATTTKAASTKTTKPVRKSASQRAMQRSKATKKAKTMMRNYFKPS